MCVCVCIFIIFIHSLFYSCDGKSHCHCVLPPQSYGNSWVKGSLQQYSWFAFKESDEVDGERQKWDRQRKKRHGKKKNKKKNEYIKHTNKTREKIKKTFVLQNSVYGNEDKKKKKIQM